MIDRRDDGFIVSGGAVVAPGAPKSMFGGNGAGRVFLESGLSGVDHVTEAMMRASRETALKRTTAEACVKSVVVPFTPEVIKKPGIEEIFSLYRPISVGGVNESQDPWSALKFMAVNSAIDAARASAGRVNVLADGVYQCVTRGIGGVHLQMDAGNDDAVEAHRRSVSEVARCSAVRRTLGRECDHLVDGGGISEFVLGGAYEVCDCSKGCDKLADALVVDLGLHPLTVPQVCTSMIRSGAVSAEVFFPYAVGMFRTRDGKLPGGGGVYYSNVGSDIEFKYPSHELGIEEVPAAVIREWLEVAEVTVEHESVSGRFKVIGIGMQGPFMRCRVERIAGRHRPAQVRADRSPCQYVSRTLEVIDLAFNTLAANRAYRGGDAFVGGREFSSVYAQSDGEVLSKAQGAIDKAVGNTGRLKDMVDVQRLWNRMLDQVGISGDMYSNVVDDRLVEWALSIGMSTIQSAVYEFVGKHQFKHSWCVKLDVQARRELVANPSDYIDLSLSGGKRRRIKDVVLNPRTKPVAGLCSGVAVRTGSTAVLFGNFVVKDHAARLKSLDAIVELFADRVKTGEGALDSE